MTQQPEAMRLAHLIETGPLRSGDLAIAAELRRLHDENRRLVNTLNHVSEVRSLLVEQRDELLEALKTLTAYLGNTATHE